MSESKPPLSIQQEHEVYVREDGSTFTRADIFVKLSVIFKDQMLRRLKGPKLSVYLCIALYCGGPEMTSWPSINTIADRTGYSRRAVIGAVQELEAMGLVAVQHRESERTGYDSNVYEVRGYATMGAGTPSAAGAPGVVQEVHPPSAVDAPGVVNDVHHPSAAGAPEEETIEEETTEEETREEENGADAPAPAVDPPDEIDWGPVLTAERQPGILSDRRSTDPLGLAAACKEKQDAEAAAGRPVGWTEGNGLDAVSNEMVRAWLTAKRVDILTVPEILQQQYGRAMRSAVDGFEVTAQQAAQAVRHVLTHPDYAWYTYSHPAVAKFKQDVQAVILSLVGDGGEIPYTELTGLEMIRARRAQQKG